MVRAPQIYLPCLRAYLNAVVEFAMSDSQHSITGTWLGNYYYDSLRDPHGFEAVFVQSGEQLEGSILDDGRLGEAHLTGTMAGSSLNFCKIYNGAARNPIHYEGTLSEDGKSITGRW